MRPADANGHGSPAKHEERDPSGWRDALEEVVRGYLEERVRHQEQHEREPILAAINPELLLQAVARVGCMRDLRNQPEQERRDGAYSS